MIKPYLFSSLLLFIGHISFGQNFGEYYVSISADSLPGRRIKFLSDTTIELSKIPRRESHSFKVIYKYISKDTIIHISPDIVSDDSQSDRFIDKSAVLKSTVILKKITDGFIDYNKSVIYVREKDFPGNHKITWIIDGKTFIQKLGDTKESGTIIKKPKRNRALKKNKCS